MNDMPKNWPALSLEEAHARLTAPGSRFETTQIMVRGAATRVWKHVPATAAEAFTQARRHGAREFLVYQDERVTFEAFARASLAVAAMLAEQGVRKGDRVALVMRNLPEWPVVFMAALLAGAIVVPLNAWWSGTELAYGILDCGARFVFADAERLIDMMEGCYVAFRLRQGRGLPFRHRTQPLPQRPRLPSSGKSFPQRHLPKSSHFRRRTRRRSPHRRRFQIGRRFCQRLESTAPERAGVANRPGQLLSRRIRGQSAHQ